MEEELQYLEDLIAIKNRRLQVLTKQVAMSGQQSSPPEKLLEIQDITSEVKELEQRKRRKIRNADNGNLYNAEELDEISAKIAKVAELEKVISIQTGTLEVLREVFYWEHQSIKMKGFIGLLVFTAVNPSIQVIRDVFSSNLGLRQKLNLTISVLIALAAIFAYAWKWIKTEVLGNIRGMETDIQHKKEELQLIKAELAKIYKVGD